jgi:hypothetical protein
MGRFFNLKPAETAAAAAAAAVVAVVTATALLLPLLQFPLSPGDVRWV